MSTASSPSVCFEAKLEGRTTKGAQARDPGANAEASFADAHRRPPRPGGGGGKKPAKEEGVSESTARR